jgi:hypothetical protein
MAGTVEDELARCADVVERYRHVLDTCMVGFIQEELFSRLPEPLRNQHFGSAWIRAYLGRGGFWVRMRIQWS